MFMVIGSAIGVILGLVTIITNVVTLSALAGLGLLLVYAIIMASYMSFGAFIGMVIDIIIEKIR